MKSNNISIFISYARADKLYFDLFKQGIRVHSKSLDIHLSVWEDSQTPVGSNWNDVIQEQVEDCDIAILLVSGNFLSSDYISQHELKKFLERDRESLIIFPVLIDPCNYKNTVLSKLQFFSCNGEDFGLPHIPEIAYADLVRIRDDGKILPNPNRERFHIRIISKIEELLKMNMSI